MNGNPEQNYSEAGPSGEWTRNPSEGSPAPSAYSTGASTSSYAAGPEYASAAAGGYAASGPGPADPGYVPPPPGTPPPYGFGATPPPIPGAPNPGLAALLGFIPGVGAMYNGQFAKGIAHIIIFSIITSVSSHAHEPLDMIFGFLTAGWFFYMVFDAYQTARARRDGMVPPDPFGLNTIGERFGLTANPNWSDFVARPAAAPADPTAPQSPPTSAPFGSTPDPYAAPGYAAGTYAPNATMGSPSNTAAANPYASGVPPYAYTNVPVTPPWDPSYPEAMRQQAVADSTFAGPNYQGTYAPSDPAAMPPVPPPSTGIPTGAIWLIGLGVLALAGSLARSFYWEGYFFGAACCFIFGTILLVQQTSVTRRLYARGTAAYRWSLLHQARFGLIVLLVGVLQTLTGAHVASWHYLWPYMLIFFGLLQIADRSLYNRMMAEGPAYPGGYNPGFGSAAAPASSTTAPTAAESEGR